MISKTKVAMWFISDILLELAEFAIEKYYNFRSRIASKNNSCDINTKRDIGK